MPKGELLAEFNRDRAERARTQQMTRYIVVARGCWEWQGRCDKDGYGKLKRNGRSRRAHQVFFEEHIGIIPNGLNVLHFCDNPPCVNPSHLFLGTILDNNRDKHAKGRQRYPSKEVARERSRKAGNATRDNFTKEERSARMSRVAKHQSIEARRANGVKTMSKMTPEERQVRASNAGKLGGIASGISRRLKAKKHAAGFTMMLGLEGE